MKYFYLILISFITTSEASTPKELVDFVSERVPLIRIYLEEENASEANVRHTKILAKLEQGHRVYLLAYELASLVETEQHNKERRERFSLNRIRPTKCPP